MTAAPEVVAETERLTLRRLRPSADLDRIARAAMELGFGRFGLTRLVAMIHPDNRPSRRVAGKLGMAAERTTTQDGAPAAVYSKEAPER